MRKKMRLYFVIFISLSAISFCTLVLAGTATHTVVEGDTLKSISIQYYGTGDLWPKLWKNNPFITDPAKLKPGDVIDLLGVAPGKPESTGNTGGLRSLIDEDDDVLSTKGVDISHYCDVNALGFLSPEPVKPWGVVVSDETERIFLGQYDNVYVTFEKDRKVKIGDVFNIYKASENLDHPSKAGNVGFAILFLGRLVLKEKVSENSFKAEIIESYQVMRVGDPVLPYKHIPTCIQPSNPDWDKCGDTDTCNAAIVASKDQYELMGQYSVVFIDKGYTQGIERGNLFAIVTRMEASGKSGKDLPDLVLGYLIIVESRLETATAIVLNAKKDFPNGTAVKAINLEQVLEKASAAQGFESIKEIDIRDELVPVLIKLKEHIGLAKDLPESLYLLSAMVKCSAD